VNPVLCVDGTALTIRPIEITDLDRLARMARRLSPASVYFRFFAPIRRLQWSTLLRLADVDHWRRDALVALDGDEIVAVARYDRLADAAGSEARDAEMAITVEDAWQHRGLGRQLARRLGALARERGCDALRVTILPENRAALGLMRALVPDVSMRFRDGTYEARLELRPPSQRANPRSVGSPRGSPTCSPALTRGNARAAGATGAAKPPCPSVTSR
jgi:GNAT superfamily N-acetyltransferase